MRVAIEHPDAERDMRIARIKLWLVTLMAVAAISAVACGSNDTSAASEAGPNSTATAAAQVSNSDPGSPQAQTAGLDENCVQNVLGRAATGFADVTETERALILEQCSGGGPAFGGGAGGFLATLPAECVEETLGRTVEDFRDITAEERSALLDACGADLPTDGRGFPGGFEQGTGGGPAGLLSQPETLACAEEALGRSITDATGLTQEELSTVFSQCLPDFSGGAGGRFGDGQGGTGFPGFGGGQRDTTPTQ
jgi:hypothetical protein